ncbi:hypothetical protein G6O69_16910 [Pseudenhygromyxa sp. WMMC2535]|uniref:hypothetical protein n=1 Tax=Pseudenhygromyxa sp. WMMC2535 TaxID=2712867 RepID=UPI001553D234|nr:hypothetical protein [Pseudenhygromyxa sp. WMMC2535]NVB39525.1 hypothetical protein [Pseudenhygromyxa sp. WMMC2535]
MLRPRLASALIPLLLAGCPTPTAAQLRANNNRPPKSSSEEEDEDEDEDESGEEEAEITARPPRTRFPAGLRASPKAKPPPIEDCDQAIRDYLALRERANRCRSDDDCAEIWPGLCPHGPYYIDRRGQGDVLVSREWGIRNQCEIPSCEPPAELGPAHCEARRCVAGREPEPGCSDVFVRYLEPNEIHRLVAESPDPDTAGPDEKRFGLAVASRGHVEIEIDWRRCPGCSLNLSRHRPVDGLQVPSRRIRKNGIEKIEFAASRALYFFELKPGPRPGGSIELRATIRDEKDEPVGVSAHGRAYLRHCAETRSKLERERADTPPTKGSR